jgi:putative endonuclease
MWRVYILLQSHGYYYIGSTNNLERRISEHSLWRVFTTSKHLPIQLLYSREYPTLEHARLVEKKLKSYKSKKMILHFINWFEPAIF